MKTLKAPCIKGIIKVSKKKKRLYSFIAFFFLLSLTWNTQTNFSFRRLSRYLGNGQCSWSPPTYDVPENIEFTKTLIAGFPSGDKRLTFIQMEALTGLSARDEWDFEFLVSTAKPQAAYPLFDVSYILTFLQKRCIQSF